jgi:hypothetical protein
MSDIHILDFLGRKEERPTQTEEERLIMKKFDLNELTYTEYTLPFVMSVSSGKLVFGVMKSCNIEDYEERNTALDYDKVKKNITLYLPLLW